MSLDEDYSQAVIDAAVTKLRSVNKPISDRELIRGTVAALKRKLGTDDKRHSSKARFRKEILQTIVRTKKWKERIRKEPDGVYALTEWAADSTSQEADSWSDVSFAEAVKNVEKLLKNVDNREFEYLAASVAGQAYGYQMKFTPRSHDGGIDAIGEKPDPHDSARKNVLCVQAKCHKGAIARPDADKFIGAVDSYHRRPDCSNLLALFITTGKLTDPFREKLRSSKSTGVFYLAWSGTDLATKMVEMGIGVKYSPDQKFWHSPADETE